MYQAGVKNKIVIEGRYELTPYYQADVDALRRVSPRFLAMLVFGYAAIVTIWYASRNADCSQSLYAFVVGSMILVELAVHVRHLRNYFNFWSVLHNDDAIRGRIEYSRRLTLLLSSVEILAFAGLYLIIALATQSWFVLGGAVGCAILSWKHWRLARKAAARREESVAKS